jgi:hypothetical protein
MEEDSEKIKRTIIKNNLIEFENEISRLRSNKICEKVIQKHYKKRL